MTVALDLVATFPSRDDVRTAVVDLERHGTVDADRIDLTGLVDVSDELGRRASDREALGRMGRGSLRGLGIGTAIGALALGGLMVVTGVDPSPGAQVAGFVGGGAFGGAAGFFYGAVSDLPVTEGGLESAAALDDESDPAAALVIHLGDEADASAIEARLRDLGARRVDRRAV